MSPPPPAVPDPPPFGVGLTPELDWFEPHAINKPNTEKTAAILGVIPVRLLVVAVARHESNRGWLGRNFPSGSMNGAGARAREVERPPPRLREVAVVVTETLLGVDANRRSSAA
jgi:hypothetical protein